MALLVVEKLSVEFGKARVLEDVSIEVGHGECVGLVGPNGAGKTTTLRTLSGLVRERSAKKLTFIDSPLSRKVGAVARSGLIHVPEGRQLVAELSVRDNFRLARYALGKSYSDDMFEGIVEYFPHLRAVYLRRAGALSGGELQMAAIARGLLVEPKLLMVDELSLGLAPKAIGAALEAIQASAKAYGFAVLLVDQNVRALAQVCDRMYLLKHGRTEELTGLADDLEGALNDLYF